MTILTAHAVRDLVERMLRASGRRGDSRAPFVDATLADGSQLHVGAAAMVFITHGCRRRRRVCVGGGGVTLGDLLATFGVDEDQFAIELAHQLRAAPNPQASGLTEIEESTLREYGGVTAVVADRGQVAQATVRSVTSNLAALTRESLSVQQTATLLRVDTSRVRHRVGDRALYGFRLGGGLRLPVWQFENSEPIPGLRAVLAALPPELHPLEVAGFMTTADPDLTVGDEAVSPRDWLIGGGQVGAVVALAADLDAW